MSSFNDDGDLSLTGVTGEETYLTHIYCDMLPKGKMYRITYDADIVSGTWAFRGYNNDFLMGTIEDGTNNYLDFIGLGAGGIKVRCTSDGTINLDNFSVTQIGAVAEYDGSGASEEHWFDISGNDLHGDVTGATLNNQGDGGATKAITLTPRALPATADASEGQIVYDTSANKLKVFNGSAWETITSS
jgi:hypothetical protein